MQMFACDDHKFPQDFELMKMAHSVKLLYFTLFSEREIFDEYCEYPYVMDPLFVLVCFYGAWKSEELASMALQ